MAATFFGQLIRPSQMRPGWMLLYAGTFALEIFCASVRSVLCYLTFWVALAIVGQPTGLANPLALLAGYGPLALSLLALILPIGGFWWQQQAGGRSPSARERLLLEDSLASLMAVQPGLRHPRRWFVLDEPALNAAAYADTLMITRGLLESRWLTAVLAHELGHLHSSDARLAAALNRLTTPPRQALRKPEGLIGWAIRAVVLVATGELALWLTRGAWGVYWRAREHQADHYASMLGQADQLAEFLDVNALPWDIPVPFVWLTEASHPPTEHRIDRLYHDTARPASPDAGEHDAEEMTA